jgi:hypothetical protein
LIKINRSTNQQSYLHADDDSVVTWDDLAPFVEEAKKMPVSEKYPNYLGSPILLANDYFDSGHFTWTTNPISFVGSSLNKLYRWELANEAHPESDKPTFHDYIVEMDLEKLTREKKQGLGGKCE